MSINRSNQLFLNDLPDHIIHRILCNLSYDEIAENRIVCQKFNSVCKNILNGASAFLMFHIQNYTNEIKNTLPRRTSTREVHPRYKHFQVLGSLSVNMKTLVGFLGCYSYFMENNLCCFIAGKVLDEAYRILNVLKNTETLTAHPFKITKEFIEIVDMAAEHFKEVIKPSLETILNNTNICNSNILQNSLPENSNNNDSNSQSCLRVPVNDSTKKEQNQKSTKLNYRIRRNKIAVLCVKGEIEKIRSRWHKQTQQLKELASRLEQRLQCVELKLNSPAKEFEKQDSLETCERIVSHIKSICESGMLDAKNRASEVSTNPQSHLEPKIDHSTSFLPNVTGPLFFLILFVVVICLAYRYQIQFEIHVATKK